MSKLFRIYTISKNRPQCVRRLALSLDHSRLLNNSRNNCQLLVLFDDKDCDRLGQELLDWATRLLTVKMVVLTCAVCTSLIERELYLASDLSRDLVTRLFRLPRSGAWAPGGIRNIVFAHAKKYCLSSDTVFFIDDDIVFGTHQSGNMVLLGSGFEVLEQMASIIDSGEAHACGCCYIGRDDMSLVDHASYLLQSAVGRLGSDGELPEVARLCLHQFPDMLPIRITSEIATHKEVYCGPGRISSGCLAVRCEALHCAPQPYWYNEDWIWLWLLGPPSQVLARIELAVAHDPPRHPGLDIYTLVNQGIGEVVYSIVNSCLPDCLSTQEKSDALSKIDDYQVAKEINNETKLLCKVAKIAHIAELELMQVDRKAAFGASEMGRLINKAVVAVRSTSPIKLGEEIRAYGRLVSEWLGR